MIDNFVNMFLECDKAQLLNQKGQILIIINNPVIQSLEFLHLKDFPPNNSKIILFVLLYNLIMKSLFDCFHLVFIKQLKIPLVLLNSLLQQKLYFCLIIIRFKFV